MRTIVVASAKGGAGKTTLCRQLSVEAYRTGWQSSYLVDTDPQGTLAAWWNRRPVQVGGPELLQIRLPELAHWIGELGKRGADALWIDTPPALTAEISQVIERADMVLIPCRPSPDDLDSIGATIDLCERARRPMVFVLNAATPRAKLNAQAIKVLSQHGTVALTTIHQSVVFPTAAISGLTAPEYQSLGKPAEEIKALWAYVHARMDKVLKA